MNSKGFQLSISTIVVLVIAVLVLVGLALFLTGGFESFQEGTEPFLEGSQGNSIKQACEIACETQDSLTYCCNDFDYKDEQIRCDDSRLNLGCRLDCSAVSCLAQN